MKLRKVRLFVLLSNVLSISYVITTIYISLLKPNMIVTLQSLVTFSLFFLSAILSTKLLNDYEKYDRAVKMFKSIKKEK